MGSALNSRAPDDPAPFSWPKRHDARGGSQPAKFGRKGPPTFAAGANLGGNSGGQSMMDDGLRRKRVIWVVAASALAVSCLTPAVGWAQSNGLAKPHAAKAWESDGPADGFWSRSDRATQSNIKQTGGAVADGAMAYSRAIPIEPTADELLQAAKGDLAQGRTALARKRLRAIVDGHPSTTAATAAKAMLKQTNKQRTRALAPLPEPGELIALTTQVRPYFHRKASSMMREKMRTAVGDRVFFPTGSRDLGARARKVLAAQARWMVKHATTVALIVGHADEPGGETANEVLSHKRAQAVRTYLIRAGVEADRLMTAAMGRKKRIAECNGAQCSAQNRRVVTFLLVSSDALKAERREARRRQKRKSGGVNVLRVEQR